MGEVEVHYIVIYHFQASSHQLFRHANAEMNATFHNKDGQPWREGDVYTRPKYAETLEVILVLARLAINLLTKPMFHGQALAEAGDKGEKNLGFYTGR